MSKQCTREKVKSLADGLTALAVEGPKKVAGFLGRMGVRGVPEEPRTCVIAQYFTHECPEVTPRINTDELVIEFGDGEVLRMECSKELADFIGRFDDHEYPELEFASEDDDEPDDPDATPIAQDKDPDESIDETKAKEFPTN